MQGVKAGESAVCTVGLGSGLNYRGYAIEDLAEKCCFEEARERTVIRVSFSVFRILKGFLKGCFLTLK